MLGLMDLVGCEFHYLHRYLLRRLNDWLHKINKYFQIIISSKLNFVFVNVWILWVCMVNECSWSKWPWIVGIFGKAPIIIWGKIFFSRESFLSCLLWGLCNWKSSYYKILERLRNQHEWLKMLGHYFYFSKKNSFH